MGERRPNLLWVLAVLLPGAARVFAGDVHQDVQFNRDIRPILSDTCFKCHGPDSAARKADLRLDSFDAATKDLPNGDRPIVPGHPAESDAYLRMVSDDPDEKMPPPKSGLVVSPEQIEKLKLWIAQGAKYQAHWALIPPVATTLPAVNDRAWPRNPIDSFVLARMESEGMSPSAEADRVTLIRRATLDLTGLPPTPAEVDAFVGDQSPNAYGRLIDRLLTSPRYGERMAMRWLDMSRYADTNGYQIDTERAQWRWRDWVIDAFNANQPFDQFTIDQIAGDLIPNATLEQKIASGFNRNHRITLEGGVIPEEYRVEYVIDRVETTSTIWLGMTMGCCRCHDHKYDPITQKEFYKFFAFFNNVPENGIDGQNYNSPPLIPAPLEPARTQLVALDEKVAHAQAALKAIEPLVVADQAKWEDAIPPRDVATKFRDGLASHYPLDGDLVDDEAPCRGGDVRGGEAKFVDGLYGQAGEFDGKRFIDCGDEGRFERTDAFSVGAWIRPGDDTDGAIVARMDESKGEIGFDLYWQRGLVHFQMMHHVPESYLGIVSAKPQIANVWHHVLATYDGSGKASGAKLYLDGELLATNVAMDTLNGASTVARNVPLQIGSRTGGGTYKGLIDDVRIYRRVLAASEVAELGNIKQIVPRLPVEKRSTEQAAAIRAMYMKEAPQEQRDAYANVDAAVAERQKVLDVTPTVMVMSDAMPRDTFILKRGQYDQPGEKVTAGTPACLPPLPAGEKVDRLALAKWLVDPKNPLTARVQVNRFWEMYFGAGIVRSTEDFGVQSEWPSHPELLDWLAVEFMRSGWDVKAMQKLIVTSATYRQASRVTPPMLEKDPANRLLARGPRLRLPAEMIRDQALACSGLLVEKLGGPSVKPYQPPKIWEEVTSGGGFTGQTYVQEHGDALFRRSMYTFWKRTVPPPTMSVFDAPSREICTVRRSRTDTPLQALALLNDTIFVESARHLAERAMNEGGTKPADRITHAFRLAVARKPSDEELKILVDGFNYHLATYFSDPESAAKLIGVGESTKNPNLDPRELAAYTTTASVILNMDQTITRE